MTERRTLFGEEADADLLGTRGRTTDAELARLGLPGDPPPPSSFPAGDAATATDCPACLGLGKVPRDGPARGTEPAPAVPVTCPTCQGTGVR